MIPPNMEGESFDLTRTDAFLIEAILLATAVLPRASFSGHLIGLHGNLHSISLV